MVLILVDSQSTVGDLCLKTGNPQLTENALRELEEGGFIEQRAEPDSFCEEGRKASREKRAAAGRLVPRDSGNSDQPAASVTALSTPFVINAPHSSEWSISRFSVVEPQAEQDAPASAEVGTPIGTQERPVLRQELPPSLADRIKAFFFKPASPRDKSEPTLSETLRLALPGDRRLEASDPVDGVKASIPSVSAETVLSNRIRRQGDSMGWTVIVILCVALALVFLTLLVFPYDRYLPELEAALSSASGRPVTVRTLRLSVYPKPAFLLGDVRIGEDKDEIRIAELRLQPVPGTVMDEKIIFREVVVSGVSLPAEVIAGLPGIFVTLSSPKARVGVRHLRFEQADVTYGGLGFSGLSGEAKLSAEGQLQSMTLRSADRRLNLLATPLPEGFDLVLEGFGWRPFSGSPFLFDSVNLQGAFANDEFSIRSMELRLFDGLVEGVAVLRSDKTQTIAGEVTFKRVNATRLGDALGFGQQFTGETSGKMRFSTAAESWATIFSALDADGEFTMNRGSLGGIDLTEAARSVSSTPTQGGVTKFENFSGAIRLTPTNAQFSGLVLNSGLMQATGTLDVSRQLNISGKIELKMRGTVNQTRLPMAIGGTLKAPTVQVGRGE